MHLSCAYLLKLKKRHPNFWMSQRITQKHKKNVSYIDFFARHPLQKGCEFAYLRFCGLGVQLLHERDEPAANGIANCNRDKRLEHCH